MATKSLDGLTKDELLERLASRRKDELVELLDEQERARLEGLTKDELVRELDAKATKDDLVGLVDAPEADAGQATKEELLRRIGAERKNELVEHVHEHIRSGLEGLTKDELMSSVGTRLTKDDLVGLLEDEAPDEEEDGEPEEPRGAAESESKAPARREPSSRRSDEEGEEAWLGEQGQRVRVDLSGLPMMGVFAGQGASAAGTIIAVDQDKRRITVYLDARFDGRKEITLPPERVFVEPLGVPVTRVAPRQ